ncbi:MAG: putative membrane protein YecN with MAPEG domain [Candidatus Azotimanducaceae bacterium]|jgi:glutathione S-transferase
MALVTMVTMLALLEFLYFGMKVGAARGKYDVKAPATTGNEHFERAYRVHYNTLEQLVIFLPALWAFAFYVNDLAAAGLGVIFLVGRMIYSIAYTKDPASRGLGMMLSFIPSLIMLLGAFFGAGWRYFF